MHSRCYNPNTADYKYYGGRGIVIEGIWNLNCKEGYFRFVADMQLPPTLDHTLDRVDTNKNYSPDNCRWATSLEQIQNRRPKPLAWGFVCHKKPKDDCWEIWRTLLPGRFKVYVGRYASLQEAQNKIKTLEDVAREFK